MNLSGPVLTLAAMTHALYLDNNATTEVLPAAPAAATATMAAYIISCAAVCALS